MKRLMAAGFILAVVLVSYGTVLAGADGPPAQPGDMVYREMLTVYYGNLARRSNGVPPLRWNASMTSASRWFSWDSVANRAPGYCSHQDTWGRWPSERVAVFGYKGFAGAENSFCGFMEPQPAVDGWMNSSGHRTNLLNADYRETGMGYYRAPDGVGYLTQDFGSEAIYPPMIIDNEAPATADAAVDLYIYNRKAGGGFRELGPATEMQLSNSSCLADVSWQPYQAEKAWSLAAGQGWRTVYVRTRDAVGRTTTASDTIYLGSSLPLAELGLHLGASSTPAVTIYALNRSWPYVRFSQNWFVDDSYSSFGLNWGNGERVGDAAAWGGTAYRLYPGNGESNAWVWTTDFFKDLPLTAYVRLKVSNNSSTAEVARFAVKGGGTDYGPLSLKGTDFAAANVYQEFPLDFVFNSGSDAFLIFNFWRSGAADVYVDGVTIYTRRMAVSSPLTWQVPDGNYRGGGIWLRYEDAGGRFSAREEAVLSPAWLGGTPASLLFMVQPGQTPAAQAVIGVQGGCGTFSWTVSDDADWLTVQKVGTGLQVTADATGRAVGTYSATIALTATTEGVLGSPRQIPVTLRVTEQIYKFYLPIGAKGATP